MAERASSTRTPTSAPERWREQRVARQPVAVGRIPARVPGCEAIACEQVAAVCGGRQVARGRREDQVERGERDRHGNAKAHGSWLDGPTSPLACPEGAFGTVPGVPVAIGDSSALRGVIARPLGYRDIGRPEWHSMLIGRGQVAHRSSYLSGHLSVTTADFYEQELDKQPGVMYVCWRSMYPCGCRAVHKVGFGLALCGRHQLVLTGTLGEGPGRNFEKELLFAWFLWGITCSRVRVSTAGP